MRVVWREVVSAGEGTVVMIVYRGCFHGGSITADVVDDGVVGWDDWWLDVCVCVGRGDTA